MRRNGRWRVGFAEDTLFDSKHNTRHMAGDGLTKTRSELVHEVHSSVIPDGRTEIVKRHGIRARPVGTRGAVGRDRSQHPDKIRGVDPALAKLVAGDEDPGGRVGGPTHQRIFGGSVVTGVLPRERSIKVLSEKCAKVLLRRSGLKNQRAIGKRRAAGSPMRPEFAAKVFSSTFDGRLASGPTPTDESGLGSDHSGRGVG